MKLDVKTGGATIKFNVNFKETDQKINVDFGQYLERTDIPKEYGLITYTQDRIITVT